MNNRTNYVLVLGIVLTLVALIATLFFWYLPETASLPPTDGSSSQKSALNFINEADRLIAEEKLEEAKAWLVSKNFEGTEDAPRLLRLALLEFNERPDAAQALLRVALDADSTNVALYSETANKLERAKRGRLAQEVYQKAIDLEPENPKLYDDLAQFYLNNDQKDLAFLTWEKALTLPKGTYLLPKVTFYKKVIQSTNGEEEVLWEAQAPLESKWLQVLQALKDEKYEQAEKLIKAPPQQGIRPDLEASILIALNYRKSRELKASSFEPHTSLQKELFAIAHDKKEPPSRLKFLLKNPEIFSAFMLDSGWDNAALLLNRYETIPEKYPTWFTLQLAQATKRVKGLEAAYLFALNQIPSLEINRLVSEFEVAVTEPNQEANREGLKSLFAARAYFKEGKFKEALEQYQKIENQSTEAKVFLLQLEEP